MQSLIALFALLPLIAALPSPANELKRVQLQHNPAAVAKRYSDDATARTSWLAGQAANIKAKYAHLLEEGSQQKRDTESFELDDVGYDSSYLATVNIGTPAQTFQVVMDTGSSDLWVVGNQCTSSFCSGLTEFNPSASSTYTSDGDAFNIQYGSGSASGTDAADTVAMGGFSQQQQGFAVVTSGSGNLIQSPASGLMGLAWQSLAQTGAVPFPEQMYQNGALSQPEFGFYLGRYNSGSDASSNVEDGGEWTLGGTDSSHYSGSLNFVSLTGEDYWRVNMDSVQTNYGNAGINNVDSAIDTGTSLIGADSNDAATFYGTIPGSQALSGDMQGYYSYPCDQTIGLQLSFGGQYYSVNEADFNLGETSQGSGQCVGAIFALNLGSGSPISWVVGDSFLKNVYSVYRYSPAAVGFAPSQ